jgi:hypothetical protein
VKRCYSFDHWNRNKSHFINFMIRLRQGIELIPYSAKKFLFQLPNQPPHGSI